MAEPLAAATTLAVTTSAGAGPGKALLIVMGKYPVAGVVALGSSVITIVILVLMSAEIGRRAETGKQRDREHVGEPAHVT